MGGHCKGDITQLCQNPSSYSLFWPRNRNAPRYVLGHLYPLSSTRDPKKEVFVKNSTTETKAVSHKSVLPKERSSWERLAGPLGAENAWSASLLNRVLERPSIVLRLCQSVHEIFFCPPPLAIPQWPSGQISGAPAVSATGTGGNLVEKV